MSLDIVLDLALVNKGRVDQNTTLDPSDSSFSKLQSPTLKLNSRFYPSALSKDAIRSFRTRSPDF